MKSRHQAKASIYVLTSQLFGVAAQKTHRNMAKIAKPKPRNSLTRVKIFMFSALLVAALFLVTTFLLRGDRYSEGSNLFASQNQGQERLTINQGQEKQHYVPYEESKIVRFTDTLEKSHQTIVTAYFQVKSKHSSDSYQKWMVNMLSLQDPMVIFLSPALIPQIQKLRSHALNRTVIIPMEVEDLPLAHTYSASFWQHQLDIDREKKIHRSYHVFWIWLSKSWWVTEAIKHNFFQSDVFVWSDMGCFRNDKYNNKEMLQHPETIPRHALLFMAHHDPNPPPELIWNNKYDQKPHFFTSGSLFAGYADTWVKFHEYFMETMQTFLDRDMFIGEDQTVLQSTCMAHPDICAYLPHYLIRGKDNAYFGLRYILHYGGEWELWRPPALAKK